MSRLSDEKKLNDFGKKFLDFMSYYNDELPDSDKIWVVVTLCALNGLFAGVTPEEISKCFDGSIEDAKQFLKQSKEAKR